MTKEAKLKGNVVEFTETKTWTEEVSSLEAEKQGCLNTIDSCRARIAEINSFLQEITHDDGNIITDEHGDGVE